jgi:hypothetical protein
MKCPECGTIWQEGETCQDHFYQMLYWEAERPEIVIVHHYLVLCYHMQHPSLYSQETVDNGKVMLRNFLNGVTTEQMRQRMASVVDSGARKFKITGTPDAHGAYVYPVHWTMTAADVVADGIDNYVENVNKWARTMYQDLEASGNL